MTSVGKIDDLQRIEGKTAEELVSSATFGGDSKGICINEGCEYTRDVEPDQKHGYCEECGTNTVVSACILVGVI